MATQELVTVHNNIICNSPKVETTDEQITKCGVAIQWNIVVVQSLMSNPVTPWTAACQASLSFTISCSLLISLSKLSIRLVMPSSHLIICHPLLLLPSVIPSFRVFSSESVLHIRWPNYWSFSSSFSPSNKY